MYQNFVLSVAYFCSNALSVSSSPNKTVFAVERECGKCFLNRFSIIQKEKNLFFFRNLNSTGCFDIFQHEIRLRFFGHSSSNFSSSFGPVYAKITNFPKDSRFCAYKKNSRRYSSLDASLSKPTVANILKSRFVVFPVRNKQRLKSEIWKRSGKS